MYNISSKYPFLAAAYHLEYYVPRNTGKFDQVSEDLLAFKNGDTKQIVNWCSIANNEIGTEFRPTIIVRALGSNELVANSSTPLDKLGQSLATHLSSVYQPTLLTKSSYNPPLKGLNKLKRQEVIRGLYSAVAGQLSGDIEILIIDDIITTGTTLGDIHRALIASYPSATVKFLALAQTKSDTSRSQAAWTPPPTPVPTAGDSLSNHDKQRAERMGLTPDELVGIRNKHKNFGASWLIADKKQLVGLASKGNTIQSIASQMGRTPKSIRLTLNEIAFGKPTLSSYQSNEVKSFDFVNGVIPAPVQEYWRGQLSKGERSFRYPPPKDSGCFIATAVYGSIEHPIVLEFRRFRDDILLNSTLGRRLIGLYYSCSPLLAPFVKKNRILRILIDRLLLLPIYLYIRKARRR